jgi:pimeloyl-ACP methyl ester carboxylesterase
LNTIRKYGNEPWTVGLLHGGPGAAGEMKPVAQVLSVDSGGLEFLQTARSVDDQIEELHKQITSVTHSPLTLIGYSWGAWLGFLFSGRYHQLVNKLILISSPAFESKYTTDLIDIRLNRLNSSDRLEAKKLLTGFDPDNPDNKALKRFGELMTMADSYDYMPDNDTALDVNMEIFRSVWTEATLLRETNALLDSADKIRCPVTAIHGDYDPHPADGVEIPLSKKLSDFKMIRIKKCGHKPWQERYARDEFYEILKGELVFLNR